MEPERRRGERRRAVRRYLRRVPLLPSLFTLGNAFCGFLAIVKVTDAARLVGSGLPREQLLPLVVPLVEAAGLLILLAMVFDGLDGKIARLTRQTTEFGQQLDSMADVVTFGVAPAVLARFLIDWHQQPKLGGEGLLPFHPKIYYLCAAVYALFAVLRLARFNVEIPDPDEKSHLEFEGLPSPGAAAVIAAVVLFWCGQGESNSISRLFFEPGVYQAVIVSLPLLLLLCGLLMVSRIPYPHAVNKLLKGRKTFFYLVIAVICLILSVLEWQIVLLSLIALYLTTGPLVGLYRLVAGAPAAVVLGPAEEEDEDGPEFDEHVLRDEGGEKGAEPEGTASSEPPPAAGPSVYPGPGARRRHGQ